jgi:multimeric flavodoxin WrbA
MKVLGISFGRVNQCSDVMVKQALFAAKKAGAEVQFINTIRMDIGHCIACGYHGRAIDKGDTFIRCPLKDDYQVLEDAVLDVDGIIIAAPVYAVGIVGQFKNFVDRFGPMHDRAMMLEENKKRLAQGKKENELLDPRYFKDRYIGYISVGGAKTHNWVSLGLPMLSLFTFSTCMKAVGQIDAYDQGRRVHPLLDNKLMASCDELGTVIAQSIGKPYDHCDTWVGEQGVCPVCHNTLLDTNGTTRVECPICGIWGDVSIKGDKLSVTFSDSEKARARSTLAGVYEHFNEIQGFIKDGRPKFEANKEFLDREMEKYKNFDGTIANIH